MKKVLGAALLASTVASSAVAADLFGGSPRAPGSSWTGFYAGVNAGYQWGSTGNNPTNPSGIAGGVQIGYNWQTSNFVFGAETDLNISGAEDVFAPWKFSNPWFGTLRGRGGVVFSNILLYGTLGIAYAGLKAESTLTGVSESKTHMGWALGFGAEVALGGKWTGKVEYLYVDLSRRAYSLTGTTNDIDSSLLRLGVNYRF
jgi:outer membrane immunogenic protein